MAITHFTPQNPPSWILDRLMVSDFPVAHMAMAGGTVGMIVNCTDDTMTKSGKVPIIQIGLVAGQETAPDRIRYATRVIKQFFEVDFHRPVLLYCRDGKSLAPGIALAYLLSIGMSLIDALWGLVRRGTTGRIFPNRCFNQYSTLARSSEVVGAVLSGGECSLPGNTGSHRPILPSISMTASSEHRREPCAAGVQDDERRSTARPPGMLSRHSSP
jgi:hypothetical protein